jgi:hypothetical protein
VSEPSRDRWPAPFEPETVDELEGALDAARFPVAEWGSDDGSGANRVERLAVVGIVPRAPAAPLKLVGPGRRERAYLERVAALEEERDRSRAQCTEIADRAKKMEAELDLVSLLERGAERRLNRAERELARSQAQVREIEQREHRLILALGALQNENQRLGAELARLETAQRRALGSGERIPARSSGGWRALLSRWLGDRGESASRRRRNDRAP